MSQHTSGYGDEEGSVPPLLLSRLSAMPSRPMSASARTPTGHGGAVPPTSTVRPASARTSKSHVPRWTPSRPMSARTPGSSTPLSSRSSTRPKSTPRESSGQARRTLIPASHQHSSDGGEATHALGEQDHDGSTQDNRPALSGSEAKESAKNMLRLLQNGNHIEREEAAKRLWKMCYTKQVGRVWLSEQGSLLESLARLATVGTKGQKDQCSGLLCLLSDSTPAAKRFIGDIPGVLHACVCLLNGSTDVQRVNAAAAIWFLSVDDEHRHRLGQEGGIFEQLIHLVREGSEHQKEQACGALRMLAHKHEGNARQIMEVASAPAALLQAASSGTYDALLQATALLAQLTRPWGNIELLADDPRARFRAEALGTNNAIEIITCILELGTRDVRIQAALCLRNAFANPSAFDLNALKQGLVTRMIAVLTDVSGQVKVHILDILRALSHDERKRKEVGSVVSVYTSIVTCLSAGKGHHSEARQSALSLLSLLSLDEQNCATASREPTLLHGMIVVLSEAASHQGGVKEDSHLRKCISVVRQLAVCQENRRLFSQSSECVEILGGVLVQRDSNMRQALAALCNMALLDMGAQHICQGGWVPAVSQLIRSEDEWIQLLAVSTLQHIAQHATCSDALGGDDSLIGELAWCSKKEAAQARIRSAICLASLSSNDASASIMADIEHDEVYRAMHLLIQRVHKEPEEAAAGLLGLSNMTRKSPEARVKSRSVVSLLDSVATALSSHHICVQEAAATAVKCLTFDDMANTEFFCKNVGPIFHLCEMVCQESNGEHREGNEELRGTSRQLRASAVGALCNLTVVNAANEHQELFSTALLDTVAASLGDQEDDLGVHAAGLICNITAFLGDGTHLVEIGKQPLVFERLLDMVYSHQDYVRSNALGALCNLAQADANKFKIAAVSGALAKLGGMIDGFNSEDRTRACNLIFYMSLSFSANREFGEQPGTLQKLVEIASGNGSDDAAVESALAAISALACNKNNSVQLNLRGLLSDLLPNLLRLVEQGSIPQQINAMVCMWNAAASCDETKALVGSQPQLLSLLVGIMRRGENQTNHAARLQAAGLLSELLNGSHRNGMLFAKTPYGLECVLEMSKGHGKGTLNACTVLVNFASASDERLRRVVEIEGGLRPILRVLDEGNAGQKEKAAQLLANRVLRSQAGRRKLLRHKKLIPLLLENVDWQGITVATAHLERKPASSKDSQKLAELCAEALSNLSSGHEARTEVARSPIVAAVLEAILADFDNGNVLKYHVAMCVASLCLDATVSAKIGAMKDLMAALSAMLCDENEQVQEQSHNEAAACAYHNMAATCQDNRLRIAKDFKVISRLVAMTGKNVLGSMHAVGALYELSRETGECRGEMMQQSDLVGSLTKSLRQGGERQKELAVSALAILGEKDELGDNSNSDLVNLQISVEDGAFQCLSDLVLSGTPQQATPATAILGNLLVSSGAYIKSMLAETKGFISKVFRQIRGAAPLHRSLSLRLLYYLIKGDSYLIGLVAKEPGIVRVLSEMLEGGTNVQRRYSCLCIRQLIVNDKKIISEIGEYNSGRVFKSALLLFQEGDVSLARAAVAMLMSLTESSANRSRVIKLERLVMGVCEMIESKATPQYLIAGSVLSRLAETTSEGARSQLVSLEAVRSAVLCLLRDDSFQGRFTGAKVVVNISDDLSSLERLGCHDGIVGAVAEMIIGTGRSAAEAVQGAQALRVLGSLGKEMVARISNLKGVVHRLVRLLKGGGEDFVERNDAKAEDGQYTNDEGHSVEKHDEVNADGAHLIGLEEGEAAEEDEPMKVEECVAIGLGALNEIACCEEGCVSISREDGHMKTFIWYADGGCGGEAAEISLSVIRRLLDRIVDSRHVFVNTEGALDVLVKSVKEGSSKQVGDAISLIRRLGMARGELKEKVALHEEICDTLVSFADDRHLHFNNSAERNMYDTRRTEALQAIFEFASTEARFRARVAARKDTPVVLGKVISTAFGESRIYALRLIEICSDTRSHIPARLGAEPGVVAKLTTGIIVQESKTQGAAFSLEERLFAVGVLTRMAGTDELCGEIGRVPQIMLTLARWAGESVTASGVHAMVPAAQGADLADDTSVERKEQEADSSGIATNGEGATVESDKGDEEEEKKKMRELSSAAALLLRVLVTDPSNAIALLKIPFDAISMILSQVSSSSAKTRSVGLSILWGLGMSVGCRFKITEKAKEITAALSHLLITTEGHEEHALLVLTILAQVNDMKISIMRESKLVDRVISLISVRKQDKNASEVQKQSNAPALGEMDAKELCGNSNGVRIAAVRFIESFARNSIPAKQMLGRMTSIAETLVNLLEEGAGDDLYSAARVAIQELSLDCDENEGAFVRLRAERGLHGDP